MYDSEYNDNSMNKLIIKYCISSSQREKEIIIKIKGL